MKTKAELSDLVLADHAALFEDLQPISKSIISARSAIRCFPLFAQAKSTSKSREYKYVLPLFRAYIISIANSLNHTEMNFNDLIRNSKDYFLMPMNFGNAYWIDDKNSETTADIYRSIALAAFASMHVLIGRNQEDEYASIATAASAQTFKLANGDIYDSLDDKELMIDIELLSKQESIKEYSQTPLWSNQKSVQYLLAKDSWRKIRNDLLGFNNDWEIWIEWYEGGIYNGKNFPGILQGSSDNRYFFGLSIERSLELISELALLPSSLWENPPALNLRFKKLVDIARSEISSYPSDTKKADTPTDKNHRVRKKSKKIKSNVSLVEYEAEIQRYLDELTCIVEKHIEATRCELQKHTDLTRREHLQADLERLETLERVSKELKKSIHQYIAGSLPVSELEKTGLDLIGSISNWWTKRHIQVLDKAADYGVKAMAFTAMAGIGMGLGSIGGSAIQGLWMGTVAFTGAKFGKKVSGQQ
jgi:hypothetical protein